MASPAEQAAQQILSWENGSNPYANASLKSRLSCARHWQPHLDPALSIALAGSSIRRSSESPLLGDAPAGKHET
jgi:hypothetical protein